jgi:hypothetical protein
MGQHRSGGLRQIVVKNGEIALTRMTPIAENDENSAAWVEDVVQEFKATMSYLSRFGYSPDEGLEVILIANPEPGELAGEKIEIPDIYGWALNSINDIINNNYTYFTEMMNEIHSKLLSKEITTIEINIPNTVQPKKKVVHKKELKTNDL